MINSRVIFKERNVFVLIIHTTAPITCYIILLSLHSKFSLVDCRKPWTNYLLQNSPEGQTQLKPVHKKTNLIHFEVDWEPNLRLLLVIFQCDAVWQNLNQLSKLHSNVFPRCMPGGIIWHAEPPTFCNHYVIEDSLHIFFHDWRSRGVHLLPGAVGQDGFSSSLSI